jgi:PAS domain S-box-containing protein
MLKHAEANLSAPIESKASEERLSAAMNALRVSEEHYRTVFQISIDAISVTHQEDGRIVDVNQEYLRMFGYEREEVIGRTSLELNIWADPQDRLKMVEALRKEPVIRDMEFILQRKNGERFWVLVSGSRIDLEGVPSFLIVVRDISTAKAAIEALRQSEERYRTVFQTSQDAITISGLEDGRFVDVNQASLSLFGYEREEVIGRSSFELQIWPDPQDRLRFVEVLRRESVCRNMEFQLRRKDGQKLWVLVSGSLIELDGVPCFLLVVRDITAAKEAAEALRVSEERYRTAFQTSLDAININRVDNGNFIDCNQAFLDMSGYKREEVIGRTSLEVGIWADARDRQTMMRMLRQNSSVCGLEVQLRKKGGEIGWGQISASLIEIDGAPCLLSITRDISDAKTAENTIRSLAFYDPLTGLPNRRHLMERLRQPLAARRTTAAVRRRCY